jgi:hypothetical protein
MKIQTELTGESRELLMRHFQARAPLHDILNNATRNELAGVGVYAFECDVQQAEELLEMARIIVRQRSKTLSTQFLPLRRDNRDVSSGARQKARASTRQGRAVIALKQFGRITVYRHAAGLT